MTQKYRWLRNLSEITKNIKDGANDGIATYDSITLYAWKGELKKLRTEIIGLNSAKLHNLKDMQDYLII